MSHFLLVLPAPSKEKRVCHFVCFLHLTSLQEEHEETPDDSSLGVLASPFCALNFKAEFFFDLGHANCQMIIP